MTPAFVFYCAIYFFIVQSNCFNQGAKPLDPTSF